MSENLRKVIGDLEFVSRIKCAKTKKVLLKYLASKPIYCKAFKEISKNLISGNIKRPKGYRKRLSPQERKSIYNLAKTKKASDRKKLIVQSGGWLWLIPVIGELIRSL